MKTISSDTARYALCSTGSKKCIRLVGKCLRFAPVVAKQTSTGRLATLKPLKIIKLCLGCMVDAKIGVLGATVHPSHFPKISTVSDRCNLASKTWNCAPKSFFITLEYSQLVITLFHFVLFCFSIFL